LALGPRHLGNTRVFTPTERAPTIDRRRHAQERIARA
jgi:hypothetical protein